MKTLRVFDFKQNIIDFRSGIVQELGVGSRISDLMVAGMPLPPEFERFCEVPELKVTVADSLNVGGGDVR